MMRNLKKLFQRNFLLLIKVKMKELKIPIIIPIPLALIEDFLLSSAQLGRIGIAIFSKLHIGSEQSRLRKVWTEHFNLHLDLSKLDSENFFQIFLELIHEIRNFGRFTLVEVKDEGVHISIKLY